MKFDREKYKYMYLSHIAENTKNGRQRPKNDDLWLYAGTGVEQVGLLNLVIELGLVVNGLCRLAHIGK
jgi:hypothetical protein